MKFRKKPLEVEAIQFDGTYKTACKIEEWAGTVQDSADPLLEYPKIYLGHYSVDLDKCYILKVHTLEGVVHASTGDWIVKGSFFEEVWPVRDDIFKKSYETIVS